MMFRLYLDNFVLSHFYIFTSYKVGEVSANESRRSKNALVIKNLGF